MIVSTRPLIDCCPVLPAAMEGRQLCQWDKDSCADAGFLKIDLLGLGMLSAVERCVEEIGRVRGTRVDLSRIPYDDKATYDAIQVADTMGVFQIESRAQMASLLRTRPRSLEDLTIQVAIVRPGPILGGAVNPYISRLQTLRENPDYVIPYEHESLRAVLKDTLGTIIFQDQVIEVAMAFAGFSPGEAEGLRRAMSRKRSAEAIEAYHQRFLEGARETHGVGEEVAERVYGMIVGFSGFGFPKAHGAAFGLLAYQSTWLRVHHGPEFVCALLNEQPMGFYAPDTLAHEAQRRGIALAPPDVNASEALCTVEWVPEMGPLPADALAAARWSGAPAGPAPEGEAALRLAAARTHAPTPLADASRPGPVPVGGATPSAIVRLGLGFILGVKEEEVKALVAARADGGPFRSLADLASRAGAGRPSLDRLAWAGACDSLIGGSSEHARRTALWQLGVAVPGERMLEGTQLSLPLEVPDAPTLRPLTPWESMIGDYATTGLTLGAHPMQLLRGSLEPGTVSIGDLARLPHNTSVKLGGLVVARQRPGTAKGIVFLLLEDEFGTINLIVPPDLYEVNRLTVRSEPLLLCEGRLEKLPQAGGGINVFVKAVRPLVAPEEQAAEVVALAEKRVAAAASGRGEGAQGGREAASTMGEFRQVSPPIQSFAAGRRR
jgi:error-prone DNA polymerase